MHRDQWSAVESYVTDLVVRPDAALEKSLAAAVDAGLPPISVSPNFGKFLALLAQAIGAKNILEIGTLAGYSTIWLARAVAPLGRIVTLEIDARHAEIAEANFAQAGLADAIELRVGRALDELAVLADERREPFDFVFIDADKANIPAYFDWSLRLTRPGSLIIVDNVIRDGAVIDENNDDPNVQGVRRFNEMLARENRVSATTLQTVGSKGYDGFTIALVLKN